MSQSYKEIQRMLSTGVADSAANKSFQKWKNAVTTDNELFDFVRESFDLLYQGNLEWDDNLLREFIRSKSDLVQQDRLWGMIWVSDRKVGDQSFCDENNSIRTSLIIMEALIGQKRLGEETVSYCRHQPVNPSALYRLIIVYLFLCGGHYFIPNKTFLYSIVDFLLFNFKEFSWYDGLKDNILLAVVEVFGRDKKRVKELLCKYPLSAFGYTKLLLSEVREDEITQRKEILSYIDSHLDEFKYEQMIHLATNQFLESQINAVLYIAVKLKNIDQVVADIRDYFIRKTGGLTYLLYVMGGQGMYINLFDREPFLQLKERLRERK